MYLCEWCGEEFDFPERCINEFDEPATCCPYCKSEDYVPAKLCKGCNEYVATEKLDNGLCENCATSVMKSFRNILMGEFKPEELKYIEDKLEGRNWFEEGQDCA